MIERQFIDAKKKEYIIKEFVKKELEKGKVSKIEVERTPLGERIIIHTTKPGLIIGRRGEMIQRLTSTLKERFKLENPQLEIVEIKNPETDAQFMADYVASTLESFGQLRFKAIAYKALQRIINSKALGAEIRLSGKLPGERAKSWRFAFGFLKKTGMPAELLVNKAYSSAHTKPGVVGVKVSIVPQTAEIQEIREKELKEIIVEEIPLEHEQAQEQEDGKVQGAKKRQERPAGPAKQIKQAKRTRQKTKKTESAEAGKEEVKEIKGLEEASEGGDGKASGKEENGNS